MSAIMILAISPKCPAPKRGCVKLTCAETIAPKRRRRTVLLRYSPIYKRETERQRQRETEREITMLSSSASLYRRLWLGPYDTAWFITYSLLHTHTHTHTYRPTHTQ